MNKEMLDYILWGSAILFWGYLIIKITWNVGRGIDYLMDLPLKLRLMDKHLEDYKDQMKYFYSNEYEIKAAVNHYKEMTKPPQVFWSDSPSKPKAKK